VEFSHLDKMYIPEAKVTKGDLVEYYTKVSRYILPYLKDRPHSLLRPPNGYKGESFFQKDMEYPPAWIKTQKVFSKSNDKDVNYLVCDGLDSLLYMAQLGCIEINPWNSTTRHLDKPDWIVIDLDPEDISFKQVVRVAETVRDVIDELQIPALPKTSGKTGIHIFIPAKAAYDYEQAKQFAQILVNIVHERLPDITSLERSPAKRQKKVYLDYLQNREGQTLAAPYSVRPTKEASVSTPLHWDEVNAKLNPADFTIRNIFKRLDKIGDIWEPVLKQKVDIAKVLKKVG